MKIQHNARELLSLVLTDGKDGNLEEQKIFELWEIKREGVIKSLLNFRKHRAAQDSWKRSPWKHLLGIKKFNKSIEGKRMHRKLGTFLATHLFNTRDKETHGFQTAFGRDDADKKHLSMTKESYHDVSSTLVALSSLRTHLYIESEYAYPSLSESVEVASLVDFAIPLLNDVEKRLFESQDLFVELDPLSVELLYRLTERSVTLRCIAEHVNMDEKEINSKYRKCFSESQKTCDTDSAYFLSSVFSLMKTKIMEGR